MGNTYMTISRMSLYIMIGYYDLVLGLIPLSLFGLTGTLAVGGLTLTTAITIASLAAIAIVGHALFVNAPVDDTPGIPK